MYVKYVEEYKDETLRDTVSGPASFLDQNRLMF